MGVDVEADPAGAAVPADAGGAVVLRIVAGFFCAGAAAGFGPFVGGVDDSTGIEDWSCAEAGA